MTTSINALLHGRIADALAANIAGPAVAVVFLAQLTCFVAAALRVVSQQCLLRLSGAIDRVLLWSLLAGWFSHFLIH